LRWHLIKTLPFNLCKGLINLFDICLQWIYGINGLKHTCQIFKVRHVHWSNHGSRVIDVGELLIHKRHHRIIEAGTLAKRRQGGGTSGRLTGVLALSYRDPLYLTLSGSTTIHVTLAIGCLAVRSGIDYFFSSEFFEGDLFFYFFGKRCI